MNQPIDRASVTEALRSKLSRYFGTTPEEYLLIEFDQNGIAYECYEETGGIGG